jgi:oligopeptide/dipeptide ABC transporter ATP-binding protein
LGLLPPGTGRIAGGRIELDSEDLAAMPARELRRRRGRDLAMVFQDPMSSLNPVQTVGHQIDEMFRRHEGASRKAARARTIELMQRVRIPDPAARADAYPHQFSGGMRQRAVIAMALALGPRLLIADEPTTALDVTVQAQIVELLRDLRDERGMALLFISHDLGVVAPLADRVAVMYAGRIVETGPTRDVYDHPRHPYTAGLLRSLPDVRSGRDRLLPIPGNPPDLRTSAPGCPFAPRCRYREPRCETTAPVLTAAGHDHTAACLRVTEIAAELDRSVLPEEVAG